MKKQFILIILFILLLTINYPLIDSFLINIFQDYEEGIVTRIIDGDTVKINDESVRLLGINSPEKGEYLYEESKNFLVKKILNKNVKIYFGKTKYDKYKRKLGYLFIENKNINLESVKQGFSNHYFPSGKDKFYNEFKSAWENCMNKNQNLCKQSNNNCLVLKELNVKEQEIIIENICIFSINLSGYSIKDEGRKKYIFQDTSLKGKESIKITNKDFRENYVLTKTGDSIFIRDANNALVLFETYD